MIDNKLLIDCSLSINDLIVMSSISFIPDPEVFKLLELHLHLHFQIPNSCQLLTRGWPRWSLIDFHRYPVEQWCFQVILAVQ
jgi:hypothetical protein